MEMKEDFVKKRLILILAGLIVLGFASIAQAQATRTWVSGVGDDANPCSRTAPCKTFAGAISKTAAGGVISVLDPGGFGGVTITKSITLDGSAQIAGVLVSGTNAIIINAASTDVVVLKHLEIHGVGTGLDAIRILSAAEVYVEDCRIQNFSSDGIEITPSLAGSTTKVEVRRTDIRNNAANGIRVNPTAATALVKLTAFNSSMSGNGNAGVLVANVNNSASLYECEMSHNATGMQVEQSNATLFAANSLISYNATGILSGLAGLTPVTRISGCTITGNTTNGISGTGTVVGMTNNMIFGNVGSNSVSSSVVGQ